MPEPTALQLALATVVRKRLTEGGLTQVDAAAFMGVSQKHLSRLLTGRDAGTLGMWQWLLNFVNIDPRDAIEGDPAAAAAHDAEIRAEALAPITALLSKCDYTQDGEGFVFVRDLRVAMAEQERRDRGDYE